MPLNSISPSKIEKKTKRESIQTYKRNQEQIMPDTGHEPSCPYRMILKFL